MCYSGGLPAGKRDVIVAGAGISGLTAARELKRRGVDAVVLEACPEAGGLTRTVHVGNYCFDYTGHLLHLARSDTPSGVPYAGLIDEEWQRIDRRSCCWFRGRLISAPLQYHLGELGEADRKAFGESYDSRPRTEVKNFRDWLMTGFGQRLAEEFLIPLNEKTLATSASSLEASAGKRFFPAPEEEKIQAGFEGQAAVQSGYNSQFWYPKTGGIERLVVGLRSGLEHIRLLEPVTEVDLERRQLRTASGDSFHWDRLFTSIPLKSLCQMTSDASLRELAAGLSHSQTVVVNLGLRGQPGPILNGVHWVYVPDPSIAFYRLGIYSNLSGGLCPRGASALYAEVAFPGGTVPNVARIEQQVVRDLQSLGWIGGEQLACIVTHVISCAYVHHTIARSDSVALIQRRVEACGVYSIGRYGLWDYTSMEDSIYSAKDAVEKAMHGL
ncbi:MAG TPA: FAD-dependent oxidoreductase [Bryobacteraceae bacterium]|nr:FAD-dependent oxidoreductase [Bryobacteraceae bacterium]